MTETPRRIVRKRTLGWRMPATAIYVGRPSLWGNPWTMDDARVALTTASDYDRAAWCVGQFMTALDLGDPRVEGILERIDRLRGCDLACWCPLHMPCHADVLLTKANAL